MADCFTLLILAVNAYDAFYKDAKAVISTVDRSYASTRIMKHVGRDLRSPAAGAMYDPLLRVYANHQQVSQKIAAGLSIEHSLLPTDSKAA